MNDPRMRVEDDDQLLDVSQVAALLRTTPKTIYDLMRDGRLGYVRIGAKRRVQRRVLRQFIADRQVEARS